MSNAFAPLNEKWEAFHSSDRRFSRTLVRLMKILHTRIDMEHLSPMMTYYTYSMHECEVPRYPLPFETANFLSRITKTLSQYMSLIAQCYKCSQKFRYS